VPEGYTYARLVGKFGEQGWSTPPRSWAIIRRWPRSLNVARAPGKPDSKDPKLAPFPH